MCFYELIGEVMRPSVLSIAFKLLSVIFGLTSK